MFSLFSPPYGRIQSNVFRQCSFTFSESSGSVGHMRFTTGVKFLKEGSPSWRISLEVFFHQSPPFDFFIIKKWHLCQARNSFWLSNQTPIKFISYRLKSAVSGESALAMITGETVFRDVLLVCEEEGLGVYIPDKRFRR
jgi:hypothetical protein